MRCTPGPMVAGLALGIGLWLTLPGSAQDDARPKEPGVGHFSGVTIVKRPGSASALDFHLDGTGRAARIFVPVWPPTTPPAEQKDPVSYLGDTGQLHTKGWVVISGTSSGTGEGYNIVPPTKDPSMLAVWSDVLGPAIQVRAANAGAGSYIFQALDREGRYTFSVEQDGSLRWGAGPRAAMDTSLSRTAARTLKADGTLLVAERLGVGSPGPDSSLHVGGSQSARRTAVRADYAVTDSDYYVGVTDTSAPRAVTLPPAAGREGRVYVIKDESGGAGTHPIMVKAGPGESIDGSETQSIRTNYGVLRVISGGKGWFGM